MGAGIGTAMSTSTGPSGRGGVMSLTLQASTPTSKPLQIIQLTSSRCGITSTKRGTTVGELGKDFPLQSM